MLVTPDTSGLTIATFLCCGTDGAELSAAFHSRRRRSAAVNCGFLKADTGNGRTVPSEQGTEKYPSL